MTPPAATDTAWAAQPGYGPNVWKVNVPWVLSRLHRDICPSVLVHKSRVPPPPAASGGSATALAVQPGYGP